MAATPALLRAPSPRVEINWLPCQLGLAVAIKHRPHATFTWELLVVIGPVAVALGLWRRLDK